MSWDLFETKQVRSDCNYDFKTRTEVDHWQLDGRCAQFLK